MKNNLRIWFLFIISGFFILNFYSCKFEDVLPSSSGKSGELVIVADSVLLKSDAGALLRDSLYQDYPGLPQSEPLFTVVTIQPDQFKNILMLHRNILFLETGPVAGDKEYSLTYKQDVWSKPQLVMNLRAKDEAYLAAAVMSFSSSIISKFMQEETTRLTAGMEEQVSRPVTEKLTEITGVRIPLPADYYVAESQKSYCWIRKETVNSSFGFQVYRFPYTDTSAFSLQGIIMLRDSLCKKYIPGPSDGSYMITDSIYPAKYTRMKSDRFFGMQVKSLWKTVGDFMGGPFESFLIHDETRGDLVFIDAYVYAPKFDKREYMKTMESIVYGVSFQ